MCARIYFVELKYSQLNINHLNDTPSTKAVRGGIYSGVFDKDVKVPVKVTRRSSLVPLLPTFVLSWLLARSRMTQARFAWTSKTLDALDVVQGPAEDKVVGVGRGTRRSPRRQRLGYVRSWKTTYLTMAYQTPPILCALHKRRLGSTMALNMVKILPMN
jgi:hypothetical protein